MEANPMSYDYKLSCRAFASGISAKCRLIESNSGQPCLMGDHRMVSLFLLLFPWTVQCSHSIEIICGSKSHLQCLSGTSSDLLNCICVELSRYKNQANIKQTIMICT